MNWQDLQGKDPIWCPGCGDFGVLRATQTALAECGARHEDIVVVTGIGCSGTITGSFRTYGFHGLHGRAVPVATGVKIANPDLTVVVAGGDGDGFGIGLGHLLHAARRNVDLTYIVMDNQVYGLTKGQTSPTTDPAMTTKASPLGPMAEPVHPLELAITAGATFVAQGFSGDQKGLASLIGQAIAHKGFSVVNVQSPCVTYNLLNTYAWFREHLEPVEHDPADRQAALAASRDHVTGILYRVERPVFGAAAGAVATAADPGAQAETVQAWMDALRA